MQAAIVLLVFASLLCACSGTTYYLYPTNSTWATVIQGLKAGDTAILAEGSYTTPSNKLYVQLSGTKEAPIVVQGAGAEKTIISRTSTAQNVIDLTGTYFSFYNMTFTGGSKGVRIEGTSSHILFDGVNIHDTADTAFSANDASSTYTALTLRRMEVYNTGTNEGECFYLGRSQEPASPVVESLVELNYCHDTANAKLGYGSGIQLKSGSFNNVIRDNVLYNTRSPGILIYDDYSNGLNLVEGNVVITTQENGIQLSSGATVRNNIVVGAKSYGIYVSSNTLQGAYHDIQIEHNTVYNSGSTDLYLPTLEGSSFVTVNNAFLTPGKAFNDRTQTNTIWLNNAYVGNSPVPDGVAKGGAFNVTIDDVTNADGNNFYPTADSLLISAGSAAYPQRVTFDFNGTPRSSSPTVGAYEYTAATNPGPPIGTHFKGESSSNTPPPSGGGAGGGSSTSSERARAIWLALLARASDTY